jgi:signal transduction histidine kinase
MDLLAGAAFSWFIVYVLLAIYFAILAARRPDGGADYATFAATCVIVGIYAFCNGQRYHITDPMRSSMWGQRALIVAPLATALALHTSALYAGLDDAIRKRVMTVAYVGAVALALATAGGFLHHVGEVESHSLGFGTVRYTHFHYRATPLQTISLVLLLGFVIGIVYLLVRAYLSGKREALIGCLGTFVMLAAVANDVLIAMHVHKGLFLSVHGYSALAFGLSYTLLARHERVSDELTLKGAELRRRAKQLRKAYEELRAAQQELLRKEQLALVGELAAVVSHEVRNPLAIISNAVAGLRREPSAEDRAMLLSILDEETARLNRLVGDLLRYAKPLHIERNKLDLDAILGRATELSRAHVNVQLTMEIAWSEGSSEPPTVFGDANMLRQVFDNLVQNACQAMGSGGTLTVRAKPTTEDGKEGVMVEVCDTGEGMDTQVRSRAGTPFFTTRPGGTGLGLAICDRIVTAHGGVLQINSRSGEGTAVSVFLPSNPVEPNPIRSSHPPARLTLDSMPPSSIDHGTR